MMLTSNGEVPLAKIQEVLRTDAAFTADVLRLANSPLMGVRVTVRSVLQAVMLLGLERIKSLATTLALKVFLKNTTHSEATEACWRHNLAVAVVCEKIASHYGIDSDICYTAGLLHDIGRLALLRECPEQYDGVFSLVHDPNEDLLLCEESLLGVDHCQAGKWILEHWEFPEDFCEVALLHHTPPGPEASDLLRSVYTGSQIADLLGYSSIKHPPPVEVSAVASFLPASYRRQFEEHFDVFSEEVAFRINGIDCALL